MDNHYICVVAAGIHEVGQYVFELSERFLVHNFSFQITSITHSGGRNLRLQPGTSAQIKKKPPPQDIQW